MMKQYWDRITAWLRLNCPEFLENLNPGAITRQFETTEKIINARFPDDFKEFYSIHNGQKDEFDASLFFGCDMLSLEDIARNWTNWREVGADGTMNEDMAEDMQSLPEGVIRPLYTSEGWIPFSHDGGGNHIGFDFDPGDRGKVGQIILFGRDEDIKLLVAETFTEFIREFTRDLEQYGVMENDHIGNKREPGGHYHNKWLKKYRLL